MDLKELQNQGKELIDVPLLFDGDGRPASGFKVVGADSKQYQDADRAWKLANVRKSARRGRGIDGATETGAAELVDLIAKREMAVCVACIVEIYGFTNDGEPAPLSEETLKAIFTARPTWRSKVAVAVESEQVFTQV